MITQHIDFPFRIARRITNVDRVIFWSESTRWFLLVKRIGTWRFCLLWTRVPFPRLKREFPCIYKAWYPMGPIPHRLPSPYIHCLKMPWFWALYFSGKNPPGPLQNSWKDLRRRIYLGVEWQGPPWLRYRLRCSLQSCSRSSRLFSRRGPKKEGMRSRWRPLVKKIPQD